jgi:hypothetical protein
LSICVGKKPDHDVLFFRRMFVRTLVIITLLSMLYRQLGWGALIDRDWFAEVTDLWFVAGSAMIVIP